MRALDRRQQILEVAQRLFIERGFEQVTMGDIAEELGTSRPTIYTYFATTTAILETLFSDGLERLWRRLEPVMTAVRRQDTCEPGPSSIPAIFDILVDEQGFLAVLHSGGAPAFQRRRRELLNQRLAPLVDPYLHPDHGPYAVPMLVTLLEGMAHWAITEGVADLGPLKQSLTTFINRGLSLPAHHPEPVAPH